MTPPNTIVRGAASVLLGVLGGCQVALAAGAPWGRAAFGGQHPGVLPASLRLTSAASVPLYGALIGVVQADAAPWRTRILTAASALFAVATVMNAASRSRVERTIWTPTAATLTGHLWAARTR